MDTIYIVAITATVAGLISGCVFYYIAYQNGYMQAVEDRMDDELSNIFNNKSK